MQKLLVLFVSIAFFFAPLHAEANPYSINMAPAVHGKVAPLKKGEKAPFAGTLFDVSAASQIVVDKENVKAQCEIEKSAALDKQETKHALALTNLRLGIGAAQYRLKEVTALKNDQIELLSTQLETASARPKYNWSPLWFAGGVLGGILITIAAGYAMGQVGNK